MTTCRHLHHFVLQAALLFVAVPVSTAIADQNACCPCVSRAELMRMSYDELACLYRRLPTEEIPCGFYRGTVITKTPALMRGPLAAATRTVWQGKWIDPGRCLMVNEVLGKQKVTARLSHGESWFDAGDAVIFDYCCSSAQFARSARDEVRCVGNGLYLGAMWIRQASACPKLSTFFILEGCPCH